MVGVAISPHSPEDIAVSLRNVVIMSAAAGLFLASGHTVAQTSPAPQQSIEKTLELINMAREQMTNKVEKSQEAYQEFRLKAPYLLLRDSNRTTKLYTKRLERDDAHLRELRQREAGVASRSRLVQSVLTKSASLDKEAPALLILLQRQGVDLAMLRQAAGRDGASPADLVRLYAQSLRFEAQELEGLLASAEEHTERGRKTMRDVMSYEVQDERLRANLDQSRDLLRAIVKRLQEINVVKDVGSKP
jgi:hypothetical protein